MPHNHHHHGESTKNLKIAFYLNLGFTLFEIIGGIFVNSIAIISDAIHDLGDTLSIGTALYLQKKSIKPNDKNFSFGYRRFSLLGAVITGLILLLGSPINLTIPFLKSFEPPKGSYISPFKSE